MARALCTLPAACRRLGWQPPVALKSVATLLTLQLLAHRTFWHACRQHGITDASLASLLDLGAAAKAALLK